MRTEYDDSVGNYHKLDKVGFCVKTKNGKGVDDADKTSRKLHRVHEFSFSAKANVEKIPLQCY